MHSGAQTPMHSWGSQTPMHPGSMTPGRAPMTPGRECAFLSRHAMQCLISHVTFSSLEFGLGMSPLVCLKFPPVGCLKCGIAIVCGHWCDRD